MKKSKKIRRSSKKEILSQLEKHQINPINELILGTIDYTIKYSTLNEYDSKELVEMKTTSLEKETINDSVFSTLARRLRNLAFSSISGEDINRKSELEVHNMMKKSVFIDKKIVDLHRKHYPNHVEEVILDRNVSYRLNDKWYEYNGKTDELTQVKDPLDQKDYDDAFKLKQLEKMREN